MKALQYLTMALLAVSTGAQATVSTTGCADASSCTLSELFGGGSLSVDNLTFDNFSLDFDFGTRNPNPANITLRGDDSGGTNPGPGFEVVASNNALAVGGFEDILFSFSFDVTDDLGGDRMKDASLTAGTTTITDIGLWSITARIFEDTFPELQIIEDTGFGDLTLFDSFDFPSQQTDINVVMGIQLFNDGVGSTAVEQYAFNVSVVPLPAALPLMLMGAGGALALGSRRRGRAARAGQRR